MENDRITGLGVFLSIKRYKLRAILCPPQIPAEGGEEEEEKKKRRRRRRGRRRRRRRRRWIRRGRR